VETQTGESQAISVIIPWSNRPELEVTLAQNGPEFEAVGAEVMVVNCAGDDEMLSTAIKRSGYQGVRRIDIPASRFNKCLAINLGVHLCRGKVLFLLDSDIILGECFLKEALARVSAINYATVKRVVEKESTMPTPSYLVSMTQHTEFTCRDGKVIRFEHERLYFDDNSKAGCGLIMMRKEDFHAVGGMNSQLRSWGYEDQDLHLRLNAVQGLSVVRVGRGTHLTHGDDKRSLVGTSKSESHRLNVAIGYDNYARGNFMGSYGADVAQWAARVIEHDVVTDEVLTYS
jgi:glycosyltransferase involved in cell wall biosynthesis